MANEDEITQTYIDAKKAWRRKFRESERVRMADKLQKCAVGGNDARNHLASIPSRSVTYSHEERMRADNLYKRMNSLSVEVIKFALELKGE